MRDGDWVYCEFTLGQLNQKDDRFEFTDGYVRHAYDVRYKSFPMSMRVKLVSDEYTSWSKKLHELPFNGLNFPDIHNWLFSHWVDTCKNKDDSSEYYEKRYTELREFCQEIIDKCTDFRNMEVNGVRLVR